MKLLSRLLVITLVIGIFSCNSDDDIASEKIAIKENKLEWGTTQLSGEFNPMPVESEFTITKIWESLVEDDHTFNHDQQIYEFNGKIYIGWNTHSSEEYGPGQAVRYVVTKDFGVTFTAPSYLFDPMEDIQLKRVDKYSRHISIVGFVEINGDLYVAGEVGDHPDTHTNQVGIVARKINLDGTLGNPFWIYDKAETQTAPAPITGFPQIPYDDTLLPDFINWFTIVDRPNSHTVGGELFESRLRYNVDPFLYEYSTNGNFIEQSQVQLPDGRYFRLWRGFYSPWNAYGSIFGQYSNDGINYPNPPELTNIPSAKTRHIIKNIDNKIVLIGNPQNTSGSVSRDPLIMSITDSYLIFQPQNIYTLRSGGNEPRFPTNLKAGAFAYPDFIKMSNGKIGLVYSTYGKEDIEFSTFNLPELNN